MKVTQIYSIINDITQEILGETGIISEDLSNIVEVGDQILDATSYDHYVESLVNRIGRTVFVDRPYKGNVPSILRSAWEFGSIMMKIQADLPIASENETWSLTNGETYNQDIYYKPVVTAKFFNKRVTFEIDLSVTYLQVRESFTNAEQLNAFLSMIYNSVEKSLTVKTNALIMRTLNYAIGATFLDDLPDGTYTGVTGVKAVNLLYKYNTESGKSLTVANCLTDIDFLAFAVKTINQYSNRITEMSNLFNIEGKARFTPKELQHLVLHTDFESSVIATLYRNSFHNDLKLENYETVPFWQGSGKSYDFSDTSKINVVLAEGENAVTPSGIIAVMFDNDAAAVTNYNRRVRTHNNEKAEFVNYFYKVDGEYIFDPQENFVVFYIA